ncbi:MAG: hypothetical protein ACK512_03410, partial [Cyanobium sp.]
LNIHIPSQGQVLDMLILRTLVTAYQRIVLDLMDSYADDAAINGLQLDRGEEARAVEFFAASLFEAGRSFVKEDQQRPLTPTWDELSRRQPQALARQLAAVPADTAEHGGR